LNYKHKEEILMTGSQDLIYGGVEAGGTKFVCAIGSSPDNLQDVIRFETTTPQQTIGKVLDFFTSRQNNKRISAIGIASFGPLDPRLDSPTFGYITSTPKPGWSQTNFAGIISRELNIPVGFDTDVNGAALGEFVWGAGKNLDTILYLTVGTGIGGGAITSGRIIHGLLHPEMGHIRIPHDWMDDPFPGNCPYHGDCFEGLASGPAMAERWGCPAQELPEDHPGWLLEARYLSYALANYTFVLSPQRLIIGGGVMNHPGLIQKVRIEYQKILNNYIQHPQITEDLDNYIVQPLLGNRAGVLGAIALGIEAYQREK
jgi:fructokinase